jgi:iron complex transport system ATP-binding protein
MVSPIEIDNLSIGYRHRSSEDILLSGVSSFVRQGELIAVIGRNGTGKSTLIRTLCGLHEPLVGKITLDGSDQKSFNVVERAKKISFVSTEIIQMDHMRVYELVALGRHPYTGWLGNLNPSDSEIVMNAIDEVGLRPKAGEFMNRISDGERQRAMIARALAQDTSILMLDEPTAFLDILHRHEMVHLLYQLTRNENKTIIFSTHDLQIALNVADRIWLLNEQNMVQGAPEDVILSGQLSMIYDGENYRFDEKNINLVLKTKSIGMIGLSAEDGRHKDLTKKALERLGWEVVPDKDILPCVAIYMKDDKPVWNYQNNAGNVQLTSLYELSLHIDQKS